HGFYQLDNRHRGVVALARTNLGDAGVSTSTLGEPRADLLEQAVDDTLVPDDGEHLSPCVQVSPLSLCDQTLCDRPEATGLCLGRGQATVLEQALRQVGQDQPLVPGASTQPRTLGRGGHVVSP